MHELRKEQFGSDISLLSFSPKPDDNFILIVSQDKPKILLVVDWERNEIIYSITVRIILIQKNETNISLYLDKI